MAQATAGDPLVWKLSAIPEPVAAAISLCARQEQEQTLLIFDLGGGTLIRPSGRKAELLLSTAIVCLVATDQCLEWIYS